MEEQVERQKQRPNKNCASWTLEAWPFWKVEPFFYLVEKTFLDEDDEDEEHDSVDEIVESCDDFSASFSTQPLLNKHIK
jgi:hypothetical protein